MNNRKNEYKMTRVNGVKLKNNIKYTIMLNRLQYRSTNTKTRFPVRDKGFVSAYY